MCRTVIFLTFLLAISFCVEVQRANNIDKLIHEFVELHTAIKSPRTRVASLVGQVSGAGRDAALAFKGFYTGVYNNCRTGSSLLNGFLNKLNGDAVQLTAAATGFQRESVRAKASAANYSAQVTNARREVEAAHARHQRARKHHHQNVLEAEEKLRVIRHVRNIVVDELLNGPAPTQSFVQIKTEVISQKLNDLKKMVEKTDDTIFTSVVNSLIEMASGQNLNDQGILRRFLASLDKLRRSILTWLKSNAQSWKTISALNRKNNNARLQSLRALSRLVAQARSDVRAMAVALEDNTHAQGLVAQALARKQRELKTWNRLCDDQARIAKLFNAAWNHLRNQLNAAMKSVVHLK